MKLISTLKNSIKKHEPVKEAKPDPKPEPKVPDPKKFKRYQSYYHENNEWQEGLIITAFSIKQADELAEGLYGEESKVRLKK
jgi:hypothetical protein